MACTTCDKVTIIEPGKHGLQYSLAPGQSTVTARGGKTFPIISCMIPRPHQPRGGWRVVIFIHGQKTEITASTYAGVAIDAKALLDLNEIKYTIADLWMNLNIQWIEHAIERYQTVKLQDLLYISTTNY